MVIWLHAAAVYGVLGGWAMLASLATAIERAFGALEPRRMDGLLAGETDSWRMWCPPSPDVYNEYDLSDIL